MASAHTAYVSTPIMRSALAILSLVAVIAAEAPYHLPRPSGPAFNLPAPAPLPSLPRPPPPPPPPAPRPLPQFQPQPQPNFGYQYQQPNIAPPVFQPAPQPQFPIHSHPLPIPQQLPQINYPQQQPLPIPQPSQSYGLPQPRLPPPPPAPIQHQPIFAPQPAPPQPHFHQPQPQPHFHQPQPQPQYHQHQPQPQYQQPQPQFQQLLPQFQQPQFQPQPQPLPQFHQPQIQQPISIPQQQLTSQGYNYQQPQIQPQFSANIPLQAQPLSNHIGNISPLSSYQADSNQYSGGHEQIHRDALDSVVVDRVQNIIKDSEHTSARNSGYLSLVSGVSLENAKPSLEISSFTHTSPLGQTQNIGLSQSSSALSIPSEGYSQAITSNSQSGNLQASFNFLPQNKPATSYGPPN